MWLIPRVTGRQMDILLIVVQLGELRYREKETMEASKDERA